MLIKQFFEARKIKQTRKKEHKLKVKSVGLSWFVVKKLKHLPIGQKNYHSVSGGKIAFINGAELLHALNEIFVDEVYLQNLPDNPTIIDCGANIGVSVLYLKRLFPNAHITAFEPDPANYALLQENVENFHLKNVSIRQEAVWTNNEILYFESKGSQASKIINQETPETQKVQAIRLKDILIKPVDFLKIDIEGAEYKVLMDVGANIQYVNNLFVEYHGNFNQANELVEMLDMLSQNNFAFYIKEAAVVYKHPMMIRKHSSFYDVQLNIFCFKQSSKKQNDTLS